MLSFCSRGKEGYFTIVVGVTRIPVRIEVRPVPVTIEVSDSF